MGWLRRAAALSCALVVFFCLAHSRACAEAVLLDFQTDWCAYCRIMEPVVRELAAEGYQVRTINGDHEPELVQKFRIEGYPTFVALRDGREVGRVSGQVSKSQLYALLEKAGGRSRSSQNAVGDRVGARVRGQSPDGAPRPRLFPGLGHLRQNNVHASTAKIADQGAEGWESAGALQPATTTRPEASPEHLIAASVRLHIEDDHGQSVGSGTVIDAREGEALILTCGHVFRELKEGGRILVDFFGPQGSEQLPGMLLSYDLNSDVGLVRVEGGRRFAAARVASPAYACRPGEDVVSIGCDNGRDATPVATNIVSINRYNHAPNLQVAFEPVQGRSGGGLFNREGHLIGVCNAADAVDRQGLFASLGAIYAELDRAKLSFVYRPDAAPLVSAPVELEVAEQPRNALPPFSAEARLTPEEQALIDELRGARGAEVICLVRSLDSPETKSHVFEINRASAAFWRELAAVRSSEPGPERKLTSLENPLPFAPWSAQRTVVAAPSARAIDPTGAEASRVWPRRVGP